VLKTPAKTTQPLRWSIERAVFSLIPPTLMLVIGMRTDRLASLLTRGPVLSRRCGSFRAMHAQCRWYDENDWFGIVQAAIWRLRCSTPPARDGGAG
jgi:hypothetical protein